MRTLSLFLIFSPMLAAVALAYFLFAVVKITEPPDPLRHPWRPVASQPSK